MVLIIVRSSVDSIVKWLNDFLHAKDYHFIFFTAALKCIQAPNVLIIFKLWDDFLSSLDECILLLAYAAVFSMRQTSTLYLQKMVNSQK